MLFVDNNVVQILSSIIKHTTMDMHPKIKLSVQHAAITIKFKSLSNRYLIRLQIGSTVD